MKKLLKKILIFAAPIIIVIILLKVDKRDKYVGLKDDCSNRAVWIYDRINNNENIDLVFLGSSHTINGINDKLITTNLDSVNAVNLAYCRLGRNLQYVLLQEIIATKSIETLVIEIRDQENRYSHPIFPYLANSNDVYLANPLYNKDIFNDMLLHSQYKIELFQDNIYNKSAYINIDSSLFGFYSSPDTALKSLLEQNDAKNNKKQDLNDWQNDFYNKYSKVYLNKIFALCEKNNIKIYFLYIPSYNSEYQHPTQIELYENYGKVLIPPADLFLDENNWHDQNHLNQTGANKLSYWFIENL